jgi:predicted RNA-binding Zn ribbon-like protein
MALPQKAISSPMKRQAAPARRATPSWDWLGKPLAVDFANTVQRRGRLYEDLFVSSADIERWSRHERPRVPVVNARLAASRLDEVRDFRNDIFALLHAAASRRRLPPEAVMRTNARVRQHPVVPELQPNGELTLRVNSSPGALDDLLARVAESAIRLLSASDTALALCDAPSCGQFFTRARPNQRWCGPACGNRARVARHSHPKNEA